MIALVTTVLNDESGCRAFFDAMHTQTRQPDEIVIVDGGSRDGTWEYLQEESKIQPHLRVFQEIGCNVARGRNLAIEQASGEIIVSTDIGCEWEPGWLEALATPMLNDPAVEAVLGSWCVRYNSLQSDWAKVEFFLGGGMKFIATSKALASSRSIAYRKKLWERIGGYPEDLTLAGDDAVYALLLHQTTGQVATSEKLLCYWERHIRLKNYLKESFRNFKGAGESMIWAKYFLFVGLKLIVEIGALSIGFVLLPFYPSLGLTLVCVGFLLVFVRIFKLRTAISQARVAGVSNPMLRSLIFEFGVKLWGVLGYYNGLKRGFRHCQECRKRLRNAGVSIL